MSFEERIQEIIAAEDISVDSKWNAAKLALNRSSSKEIHRWLEVQQMILNGTIGKGAYGRMHGIAIQEFWIHCEHSETFIPWLRECKERKIFKDTFVNRYIDETLECRKSFRQSSQD
jgi:hypothetical protein